jgi:hypothetical protein
VANQNLPSLYERLGGVAAADAARPRRRCYRIESLFVAVHESAFGTKQANRDVCCLSAFGDKADMS